MMSRVMKEGSLLDYHTTKHIDIMSAKCTHPVLEHLGNSYYKCMTKGCGKMIDKWTLERFHPQPCYDCDYKKEYERKQANGEHNDT